MLPNFDGFALEVMPEDPTFASGWTQHRGDYAKQRTLPTAVMSNDSNDFTRFYIQGNPAQGPARSETARESTKRDWRCRRNAHC